MNYPNQKIKEAAANLTIALIEPNQLVDEMVTIIYTAMLELALQIEINMLEIDNARLAQQLINEGILNVGGDNDNC